VVVSTRDLPALLASLQKTAGAMRTVFDQANLEAKAHPRPRLSIPHTAPDNETERIILAAWEDVLGIEGLGIHDPYFELGGDSLHAMPLIARLREAFGIEIPLRIVYSHGTVAEMARFIGESRQADEPPAAADSLAATRTVPGPMPTPPRVHPHCAADSAGS
jgi:polyketide synthase 12